MSCAEPSQSSQIASSALPHQTLNNVMASSRLPQSYNPYSPPYIPDIYRHMYQLQGNLDAKLDDTPRDSIFLLPQSLIFASYLQAVQFTRPQNAQNQLPENPSCSHVSVRKQYQGNLSPTSLVQWPRGPPRKPKQSSFALWVGNLPPTTTLIELCSLFGTPDILSISLIQRTLCAFVNYSSEASLKEGISAFESRGSSIRGNHLVIKIQHSNKNGPKMHHHPDGNGSSGQFSVDSVTSTEEVTPTASLLPRNQDRYFICKSLTVEDLQTSYLQGLWATQSHNQSLFNEAYKSCKNVYLIFSANRTGEYFGYAKMAGEISMISDADLFSTCKSVSHPHYAQMAIPLDSGVVTNQQQCLTVIPQFSYTATSPMLPRVYLTAANPAIPIPAGRIVDDSTRGTLFWEISDDSENWEMFQCKELWKEYIDIGDHKFMNEDEKDGWEDKNGKAKNGFKHFTSNEIIKTDFKSDNKSKRKSKGKATTNPAQMGYENGINASTNIKSKNIWTVPFKIQWLSPPGITVPFYYVRNLRNSYSSNQLLKIARDGTEIDPYSGKQLTSMFDQLTKVREILQEPKTNGDDSGC